MATKNMTNIGEKIKRLRETAKVTQTQLAEFLSIDQSLISKIEKANVQSRQICLAILQHYFAIHYRNSLQKMK